MSVVATIAEKAVEWAYKHFTALNVCWLCVAITLGGGWFITANYATADAVGVVDRRIDGLTEIVTELRADATAKRIFDYQVRKCEAPPEQRQEKRWLSEQIREDAEKYQKITGHQFMLPGCGDL
jgi:hypothetical protein